MRSELRVRAELVERQVGDGAAVDAIQLMATNEGQDAILLRGAGFLFPPGLRYFLQGHVPYPQELLPGNSAVERADCSVLVRELAWYGVSGKVRLQAVFVTAPRPFEDVYERQLSAKSETQGWGPAFYSEPFVFDVSRWQAVQ
jgi:hypothetical protein